MDILIIILSLVLLIYFAYRGYSVIFFAPIFAVLAATSQGLPVMPTYTELFMIKAVTYVKNFFPIFLLGAIFGKIMETTGMAQSIAKAIIGALGPKHAALSTMLSAAVLTYGGVSMFVVVFAVYPFAAALYREANIPKRLVPAAIFLGAFTFTMDALPGSPQIQNVIPSNFLGTSIYSGAYMGFFVAICMAASGMMWLNYRIRVTRERGEGYGTHTINENPMGDKALPSWQLSVLPLAVVLVVNYIGSNLVTWNPEMMAPIAAMKLPLAAPAMKNVIGTWSLIIAVACGIATACAIGYKSMLYGGFKTSVSVGASGALLAILTVASEVGYGNVVATLPGFKTIAASMLSLHIGDNPLASMAVTINAICGITASASGGVSIALDLFSKHWMEWAQAAHMSPDVLHRFAAIASGGFDTGPHNGAIITLLAVCGLTHRESYPDIFAITILKVAMVIVALAFYMVFGFA